MTKQQLMDRYRNIDLVNDLIRRKVADGDVRPHKDFPGNAEMTLYRCWDSTTYDSDDEVSESTTMSATGELDKEGVMSLAKSGLFDKDSLGDVSQASSNRENIPYTYGTHMYIRYTCSATLCMHTCRDKKQVAPYLDT